MNDYDLSQCRSNKRISNLCIFEDFLVRLEEWVLAVSLCHTQVTLRVILGRNSIWWKGENLTLGRLKDYFGVFDKGVWAVSSCLTRVSLNITFGKRVIFFYVWGDVNFVLWITLKVLYIWRLCWKWFLYLLHKVFFKRACLIKFPF